MASIFTYEPDPPRVSSPWLAAESSGRTTPAKGRATELLKSGQDINVESVEPDLRLEAEPQEGPTEYKLHLLLRPRRSLSSAGSGRKASGSHRCGRGSPSEQSTSGSNLSASLPSAASNSTRQHRLEQLTTQLLWRLQQSSPHHSTSLNNLVLPSLPQAMPELRAPEHVAKLLPGLEESDGALYEIGVSDDGTLIGITMDEMTESLTNLRAMAASLGCQVEVLRMVSVGTGSRIDDQDQPTAALETLYVAEAYIRPVIVSQKERPKCSENGLKAPPPGQQSVAATVEQLRVSLTGTTTCGKSSLLGTLSTSTLDNGRGKSRLSLLKHRHEIASGVTSSVAQELVGYQAVHGSPDVDLRVLNYASQDVSTWSDIQATPGLSRSTLLIDSAGHPRFRRTTVRGLVGWAPHWTCLCIAANEDVSALPSPGDGAYQNTSTTDFLDANAHISMAHLELCLKLDLPFMIVITKFDEATRVSFRQLLSTLLTRLKSAGRKPVLMSNDSAQITEPDLQSVPTKHLLEVDKLLGSLEEEEGHLNVPILFTSAVNGIGITKLHALLSRLPICHPSHEYVGEPLSDAVFHVDDSFNLPFHATSYDSVSAGSVVSGYMKNGQVSIGDVLSLGPQQASMSSRQSPPAHDAPALSPGSHDEPFLEPRSFNVALARTTSSPRLRAMDTSHDWLRVKIISIRNLRLPVHTLRSDQVGTIGIVPLDGHRLPLQVRKGMVLAEGGPQASHTFTARFAADRATSVVVGSVVIIYCKTVRAGARIVAVALDADDDRQALDVPHSQAEDDAEGEFGSFDEHALFTFGDHESSEARNGDRSAAPQERYIRVTLQFVACKEYVELGAQVLVMPSGGALGSRGGDLRNLIGGLEGFVGWVVETFK